MYHLWKTTYYDNSTLFGGYSYQGANGFGYDAPAPAFQNSAHLEGDYQRSACSLQSLGTSAPPQPQHAKTKELNGSCMRPSLPPEHHPPPQVSPPQNAVNVAASNATQQPGGSGGGGAGSGGTAKSSSKSISLQRWPLCRRQELSYVRRARLYCPYLFFSFNTALLSFIVFVQSCFNCKNKIYMKCF
uniref:Homeobox B3a n=1 Tax=Sinocyclocheilus anshuiensis TaxID=1608454 RepID=A0A671MN13_9TELE